ncbi:trypsin-like peptidase domain-containing protein [Alkalihalobacillus sp. FSL W8-0930]
MKDDRREDEIMEGEPEPEDFLPNEPERKKPSRWWVKLAAVFLALILLGNAGAFLLEYYGADGRGLMDQSEELSTQPDIQTYKESIVHVQRTGSKGTGFFYGDDGQILTNHHVAEGEGPLIVTTVDGEKYQADIVHEDEDLDLALLTIESDQSHETLPLSVEGTSDQQSVYIIGNPLLYDHIAITGHITEHEEQYDAIQIDASIFQGHSGSPVISESGKVVGVIYAKTIPGFSSDQDSVGLAIPIDRVHAFLAEADD